MRYEERECVKIGFGAVKEYAGRCGTEACALDELCAVSLSKGVRSTAHMKTSFVRSDNYEGVTLMEVAVFRPA